MKTLNTSYLKCVFWRYNVLRNNNVFIPWITYYYAFTPKGKVMDSF
jgi:hypothetical protein